jgi:hypothetical protein
MLALEKAGSLRALNFYLLGAAVGFNVEGMPLTVEGITERINALSLKDDSNLIAFELGIKDAKES